MDLFFYPFLFVCIVGYALACFEFDITHIYIRHCRYLNSLCAYLRVVYKHMKIGKKTQPKK